MFSEASFLTRLEPVARQHVMDSDSDSPFNYSWPSFPRMRMRKKEKSQSTGESQTSSPTLAAAARLSAMIHGKDRVYANAVVADQADDVDVKYRSGLSPDVGSLCWDPFSTISPDWRTCPRNDERAVRSQKSKESPLRVSPPPSFPSSPLASAFRLFEGGQRRRPRSSFPVSPTLNGGRCNLPLAAAAHGLSPSLECDSGEEDLLGRSYPCSAPTLQSGLPDLKPSQKLSKKPEEGEVRLRSYSYSSPKARPSRPSLNRDATITDLAEEQSVLNLSETSKEKRVLGFRKRAQSAEEESGASLQHLTLSEFLKEMEDEEWDKYIVPSKVESEKYKVSRTFSFLKSRMSSTRGKTKVKGKEVKDGKDKNRGVNGHQFAPASPSAPAVCVACDKSICGKDALQCSNCLVNVHKNCRDSVAQCGKKLQEKNVSLMKSKNLSLPQTSAKDLVSTSPVASSSVPSSLSLTPTTKEKSETLKPLSKSLSASLESRRPSDTAAMEVDSVPPSYGSQPDEGAPLAASLPSVVSQDDVVAPLLSDLSADLLGLDVESWSLAVSPDFCRQHDRRAVKRQDVIYELMQTELHHIQTLTVMSEVFRRGMLEELQLGWDCVARIFPCLDSLLLFHRNLFGSLQERRQAASQADNPRNYLINQIGDVLLQQFSDGNAETMKRVYGDFCSHHLEAVSVFKELQQHNKKLQIFVKQQSNNLLVRRREIPEFILLVTQRITKYPVLLERILHYTQEGSQEHTDLSSALAGIRDIIGAVDLTVSEYERSQELQEVLARLENKSFAKLKSGKVIRKQDLHSKQRHLRHKGLLYWKTATGRLKDTLALLLTDVVVILQEKDQRFVFAAVDQKPPVIPLQKLIVREVANEERGMFLISASSAGPEMYEVHTSTREERNAWMRHIRQAVESCPEEEEEEEEEEEQQQQQQQRSTETEEAKRAAEVKVQKISKFQETLFIQDQRICTSLEEKLQLYAELTELTLRSPEAIPHRHLLVQAELDSESPRPASTLLAAALREAENLIRILQVHDGERDNSPVRGCECPNYNSHGSSIQESPSEPDYLSTLSMSSTSLGSDSEGTDGISWSEEPKQSRTEETLFKVAESVQSLTQLLYSLQAAVTLQDSCLEIQKILLQEGDQSQLKSLASLQNTLETAVEKRKEDVEKKATERKKEEVDEVHKLHVKLKLEQQRWDKKCVARDKRQTEQEGALEQRERHCILEAQRLRCERQELETQLMEYQHSLDRLRDGQESVDREKEKLRAQQCLLQSWRHNRQSSLPVTIPLDEYEVPIHSRSGSLDGSCWTYEKDAALLASLQKKQQQQHLLSGPRQSSTFGGADLSLSASLYNSLNTLLSQTHRKHSQDALTLGEKNHGRDQPLDTSANPFADRGTAQPQSAGKYLSPQSEGRSPRAWRPEMPGQELSQDAYSSSSPSLTPLLPQQSYLSLEGHLREDASEENIVYL